MSDLQTRRAYDAVATQYAAAVPDLSVEAPLDRAVLAALVEEVAGHDDPLVVEIGCGTGRVTRYLRDAGLRVLGLDLSPGMLAVARATHPDVPFAAAHAAALPLRDGAAGALVAWYSLIHLPPADLPAVAAELARVMRPGAPVVVAFQSGDGERVDRTTSYGEPVPLTYYRHGVDGMTAALEGAGLVLSATVTRAPSLSFETTPQAVLLAHRRSAQV